MKNKPPLGMIFKNRLSLGVENLFTNNAPTLSIKKSFALPLPTDGVKAECLCRLKTF